MNHIDFGNIIFDAVVCLNSDLPDAGIFGQFNGIPLIAADGAAIRLADIGIMPDLIIGDLDSFFANTHGYDFSKSVIIHEPDQDSNDFEKSLRYCAEIGYNKLLITGFHGGELEHTLNNWSVFMRYSRTMNLCVLDMQRYGIAISEPTSFDFRENEMVSLIPQPEALLSTSGLHWELNDSVLSLGKREGARNKADKEKVEIIVKKGKLFVFFDARLPFAPEILTI